MCFSEKFLRGWSWLLERSLTTLEWERVKTVKIVNLMEDSAPLEPRYCPLDPDRAIWTGRDSRQREQVQFYNQTRRPFGNALKSPKELASFLLTAFLLTQNFGQIIWLKSESRTAIVRILSTVESSAFWNSNSLFGTSRLDFAAFSDRRWTFQLKPQSRPLWLCVC